MFVLSSVEDQCTHFKTLFSKHKNCVLIILQKIIQSQRLMNVFTVLEGVLKDMSKWIRSNLHKDQTKYVTNSQVDTTNNVRRATDALINQGVNTDNVQCYNTHQESILSDVIIESDIYDNYSHTLCVDWKIEKTPEARSKKLEFNIDKPKTGLKKIDFNININDNEIDDMNSQEVVHSSDDLTDDECSNIEDHKTQHKEIHGNNSFYTLVDNKLQSSSYIEDSNKTNDWKLFNSL